MNKPANNPNPEKRPKSLWEVMGQSASAARAGDEPPSERPESRQPPEEHAEPLIRLKSLWQLMWQQPAEPETDEVSKETTATPLRDEETSSFELIAAKSSAVDSFGAKRPPQEASPRSFSETPEINTAPIPKPISRHVTTTRTRLETVRSRKAVLGAIAGVVAIVLSSVALLPGLWTKLPALAVGFLALFTGFLAADEIKIARGRVTGSKLAVAGIVLGICGMFLGPALSWTLGQFSVFSSGSRLTGKRLETIGNALNRFHDAQGGFPAGGTFVRFPDGSTQPQHGWMTSLLPYLGHDELYRSINLSMPFDDPMNQQPMREQVPEFLAAGVDQTTSVKGFGAGHFSGVGGEETDANGRILHHGIFDRNSKTRRGDIRDGLSNTLIAGEIPGAFPAWGEPQNWRQIGKGLNREPRGFGNAAGGPTQFLMADGSIRTFAADTDPEVLRQLSTRDGGE